MDVTPHELRDCQITDAFRGYNRDEVNELMERAAATIETQAEKIRILTERVSSVTTDASRTRDNEDIIQRTLILAQRAADEALADAQQHSSEVLADAEARSRAMVDAANAEVRRVHDVERVRLDGEIRDLSAHRDALQADVAALEGWEREYRGRVIGQLEADLATARAKRAVLPEPPPAPTAGEPPQPAAAHASEPTQQQPVVQPAAVDEERDARVATAAASATTPAPAAAAPAASAPPARVPQPDIDLTGDRRTAARDADVVEAVPVTAGGGIAVAKPARPATPEAATAPLAGSAIRPQQPTAAAPAPAPAPTVPAPAAAAPAAARAPGDTHLDDDAFFATLREAVRDDAPLGPSDERLFDERDSGRRDIFKRRR
jgi:cell division septum initiation protein DivIVA